MPKQYTHVKKKPSSTLVANYPKGEPVVYLEKMHVYVYEVSYCNKGAT